MNKQKSYFISHGAPTLIIEDIPAREFLRGLSREIEKPDAILIVSAHWETKHPTVNSVKINETIHDFYGFPQPLYQMKYEAPGSEILANEVMESLSRAGLQSEIDDKRGLDHGAWVPLKLIYPEADIPVLQVSIQSHLGTGHHLELGRAISHFRSKNILIIASGSFTHNLRALNWRGGQEEEWSKKFCDWYHTAIIENRTCDLLSYRRLAPFAEINHPTDEHLLPLYVAMGAAGKNFKAKRIHSSAVLGSLRMDSYSFD